LYSVVSSEIQLTETTEFMRLFFALFVFFHVTFTPSKIQYLCCLLRNHNWQTRLSLSEKQSTTLYINQIKTIAIMDYLLSKGITKMSKIPDKNNYQYSFNQTFKSIDFSKTYNLIA
jgi:hypothetical protein